MADVHTPLIRSKNMAAIKGKNTKSELFVRRYLFSQGLRYRVHAKLPGRPDIVFPGYKVAIFVHGCFWHCHGCANSIMPKSNIEFWSEKLKRNAERDKRNIAKLQSQGWKVLIIWECTIKNKLTRAEVLDELVKTLKPT